MDAADHAFESYSGGSDTFKPAAGFSKTKVNKAKKLKPNEPCSCGSGKKYKKCCMNKWINVDSTTLK